MAISDILPRARGCLLGLAMGDALGAAVEFRRRGTFPPVTGPRGGGPHGIDAGVWTDDTSMALALADSLLACGRHDGVDQSRRYVDWWKKGEYSPVGRCFDIGGTVVGALRRFQIEGSHASEPTAPDTAGNGSIMRLAPAAIFRVDRATIDEAEELAAASSRTTHGAPEAVDACRLLARIQWRALRGADRDEALLGDRGRFRGSPRIVALADGSWRDRGDDTLQGSGYVVESLEAALACVGGEPSWSGAVLRAVNLGRDADTTGAVAGQIAGALHGDAGIPAEWLAVLAWRDRIAGVAEALVRR